MGKSRSRSAKGANVFRIARSGAVKAKAKGKARPVTSGLKQVSGAGGGGDDDGLPGGRRGGCPPEGLGPAASPVGPGARLRPGGPGRSRGVSSGPGRAGAALSSCWACCAGRRRRS